MNATHRYLDRNEEYPFFTIAIDLKEFNSRSSVHPWILVRPSESEREIFENVDWDDEHGRLKQDLIACAEIVDKYTQGRYWDSWSPN